MTDIQGLDPPVAIETLLKGKDDQEPSNILRDRPYPTRAPRPYLRTDKIDHWDTKSECPAGEPQVEIRKIHKDHQIGASVAQTPDHTSVRPPDGREPGGHLDETDHRQIASMRVEADTRLAHPVSSNAFYSQVRGASSQLSNDTGGMQIS
jgi:hypothetical protein